MSERLHKLLAQHGLGSRREIEKWMLDGRVLLNNRPVQPGDRYRGGDRVFIDGKDVTARLRTAGMPQVLIYHKPQGQPVFADSPLDSSTGEKPVMECLPVVRGVRWLAVNSMQAGDSGLLLVTSDGQLADALRRRAETTPAAYVARVLVPTPEFDTQSIPRVVQYDEDTIEFESVEAAGGEGTNRWFRVESTRAHRRAAVRALFESRGLKVSRVIQVKFADLELPRDLPRGRHRVLSAPRVAELYARAELAFPAEVEPAARLPERARRRPPPDRRKAKRAGVKGAGSNRPDAGQAAGGRHAPQERSGRAVPGRGVGAGARPSSEGVAARRDVPGRGRSSAPGAAARPGPKSAAGRPARTRGAARSRRPDR